MSDWEERYLKSETPWEKGVPHPALVEFLRREPMRGRVLVPGCGSGNDVRAIAATADEVVGLDIAPSAIRLAKSQPEVGGESYESGDFFDLPGKHRGVFDWVFEHTCFCAIDPAMRVRYVEAAASALAPGGRLLAVFFLNPDMEPGESGPPFGVGRVQIDELFAPYFLPLQEWLPTATFPGREGRECCRVLLRR